MAVNGFILDQYVGKKVSIIIINNGGTLEGVLKKDGRKFILDNSRDIKLTISKIASIKEVE